ncbi:PREDICTED: F-box protein At5g25290-like [Camelina sativa]|uniref:F-box protein At5g25290-like n=1 Tax=Camelina sativa TaxID=90675 RepID=A0ABM0YJ05_CAMSA|nr:PREDICTED: F-box protein At5g25290-like [Camelina sativa]
MRKLRRFVVNVVFRKMRVVKKLRKLRRFVLKVVIRKMRVVNVVFRKMNLYKVERVEDNEFTVDLIKPYMPAASCPITTKYLRGLLWVDDKKKNGVDYVVVWQFQEGQFLGFCRNGVFHYRNILIRNKVHVPREFRGLQDVVLKGHRLYYLSHRCYIRQLDLSGQGGFKDVYPLPSFQMWKPSRRPSGDLGITGVKKLISSGDSIAVTTSRDVLLVYTRAYEPVCESSRIFRVFKSDPKDRNSSLVEVECLGDEALFFDLGITVPADPTLGIEPNSIYFTRNDRFGHRGCYVPCLDICVYNIATRTIKRFLSGSTLKLKDAQWFLPSA